MIQFRSKRAIEQRAFERAGLENLSHDDRDDVLRVKVQFDFKVAKVRMTEPKFIWFCGH
jgi:hypothetical protein